MNSSIHIRKRSILTNNKTLNMKFSKKSGIYIMPKERSIDIDSEFEFNLFKKRINK